jgi:hypothetical protein
MNSLITKEAEFWAFTELIENIANISTNSVILAYLGILSKPSSIVVWDTATMV